MNQNPKITGLNPNTDVKNDQNEIANPDINVMKNSEIRTNLKGFMRASSALRAPSKYDQLEEFLNFLKSNKKTSMKPELPDSKASRNNPIVVVATRSRSGTHESVKAESSASGGGGGKN